MGPWGSSHRFHGPGWNSLARGISMTLWWVSMWKHGLKNGSSDPSLADIIALLNLPTIDMSNPVQRIQSLKQCAVSRSILHAMKSDPATQLGFGWKLGTPWSSIISSIEFPFFIEGYIIYTTPWSEHNHWWNISSWCRAYMTSPSNMYLGHILSHQTSTVTLL